MVGWHGTPFHRVTTVWALLYTSPRSWRRARPYARPGGGGAGVAAEAGVAGAMVLLCVAAAGAGPCTGAGAHHPSAPLPSGPPRTSSSPLSPMRPLPETYRGSRWARGQNAGRPGETLPKFFLALGESIFLLAGDIVHFRVEASYGRCSLECYGSCLTRRGTS